MDIGQRHNLEIHKLSKKGKKRNFKNYMRPYNYIYCYIRLKPADGGDETSQCLSDDIWMIMKRLPSTAGIC